MELLKGLLDFEVKYKFLQVLETVTDEYGGKLLIKPSNIPEMQAGTIYGLSRQEKTDQAFAKLIQTEGDRIAFRATDVSQYIS